MPTNPLTLAQRFRSQLAQIDVLQGQQLLSAYAPIRNELNASIDALLMEIELMGNPSVSRVQRSDRYKRLMDELGEKLVQFSLLLMVVMRGASHQGFVVGAENGAAMLAAYGLRANVVSADAVEQLAAFLDPSGPLYARIRNLAPYTVQRIADAISDGVAMGQNPRTIAAAIDRAFGLGLTDSLRMTRTVQVYSYRYANHASYMANGIESWTWFSRLDPGRTCMSCVQMHGSVHPATETLNDHHNGLCLAIPNVAGANLVGENGEVWFGKQSDSTQLQMMGPGRFQAWKDGALRFGELSTTHHDEVYGDMRIVAPLKGVVK
jgi:hypothetical protein